MIRAGAWGVMAKRWNDLSERQRRVIILAAVLETALKVAMLFDLKRRSPDEVRGSKWFWRSTALINSGGIAPLAYFLVGRRRARGPGAPG